MLPKSYYLVLGVSPSESGSGIRRAFLELVRRYHPDRVGPRYLSFFQEIVDAYRVLSDPERRRYYDRGLVHAERGASPFFRPIVHGGGTEMNESLVPTISSSLPVQMDRLLFEAALARIAKIFGDPAPHPEGGPRGLDVQIVLSPEQAAKGGTAAVAVPSWAPCSTCGGTGRQGLFPCAGCDGEGLSEEDEIVRANIPPMVGNDTLMEVPLRGLGVHNYYLRLHVRVGLERPYRR